MGLLQRGDSYRLSYMMMWRFFDHVKQVFSTTVCWKQEDSSSFTWLPLHILVMDTRTVEDRWFGKKNFGKLHGLCGPLTQSVRPKKAKDFLSFHQRRNRKPKVSLRTLTYVCNGTLCSDLINHSLIQHPHLSVSLSVCLSIKQDSLFSCVGRSSSTTKY